MEKNEKIYSTVTNKYIDNLSLSKRKCMYNIFQQEFPEHLLENILDVGITADRKLESYNFFEKLFPVKSKIIAISNEDGTFLEKLYPGLIFKQGNAKELPFPDASIDVIFSSAVIEHVGSFEDQTKMIAEAFRVAKIGVFFTTPNRWHPIDPHTFLPLLHWLPKNIHRKLLKMMGFNFLSEESNLNLLDCHTLKRICKNLGIKKFYFRKIKTFGVVSNLMLIIKK